MSRNIILLDRANKSDAGSVVNAIYEHYYDCKKYENLPPIHLYPEGVVNNKDQMGVFKIGAFLGLKDIQYIKTIYYKDVVTGIDISNSKSMVVEFLLDLARTYTILEYDIQDKL